jgi:hypothetical protein
MPHNKNPHPRVFLIEPCHRLDLSSAQSWGPIVSLFEFDEQRCAVWSLNYIPTALQRLEAKGFQPHIDRVLIAGPIINLVMVTTAMVAVWPNTPIKALYFCGETRKYVERYLGTSRLDKFTLPGDAIQVVKHTSTPQEQGVSSNGNET